VVAVALIGGLLGTVALGVAAVVVIGAWPAAQAARVRPAVILRRD
jgi:hypothetical protein